MITIALTITKETSRITISQTIPKHQQVIERLGGSGAGCLLGGRIFEVRSGYCTLTWISLVADGGGVVPSGGWANVGR
jgi:hypothetical protein